MGLLDFVPEGARGWGYGSGDGRVSALRDMIDGGGMGRAGDRFEGTPTADVLNFLGIRPAGYRDRQAGRQAAPGVGSVRSAPSISPRPEARGFAPMPVSSGVPVSEITQSVLPPPAQSLYDYAQPPVTDQQLMLFAQAMDPDDRHFFMNSDRPTQVRSYLQAMGY